MSDDIFLTRNNSLITTNNVSGREFHLVNVSHYLGHFSNFIIKWLKIIRKEKLQKFKHYPGKIILTNFFQIFYDN